MVNGFLIKEGIWEHAIKFMPHDRNSMSACIGRYYLFPVPLPANCMNRTIADILQNADMDRLTKYLTKIVNESPKADECEEILRAGIYGRTNWGFEIETPGGILKASVTGDDEYPGIAVTHDSPGEPGCVIEYDGNRKKIACRVWDGSDPENDPQYVIDLLTGRYLYADDAQTEKKEETGK